MNANLWRWVFTALLAGLLVWGIWTFKSRRTGHEDIPEPPPGNPVEIYFGRRALVVEGDGADPIEQVTITRDGKEEVAREGEFQIGTHKRVIFFDTDKGPFSVRVKTLFREDTATGLMPTERRAIPVGHPIPLALPDDWKPGTPLPTPIAFSPDGKLLAIATPKGQLKLHPLFAADGVAANIIDARVSEYPLRSLAFSADGKVLLVGEESPEANVRAYDAQSGKELWKVSLVEGVTTTQAAKTVCVQALYCSRRIESKDFHTLLTNPAIGSWQCELRALESGVPRADYPKSMKLSAYCSLATLSSIDKIVVVTVAPETGGSQITMPNAENVCLPQDPTKDSRYVPAFALLSNGDAAFYGLANGKAGVCESFGNLPTLDKRWSLDLGAPFKHGATDLACRINAVAASTEQLLAAVSENGEWMGGRFEPREKVHPEAQSIQAFDAKAAKAERLWRFECPADPQALWLDASGRWLCAPYRKDASLDAQGKGVAGIYGLLMFDLQKKGSGAERLAWRLSNECPFRPEASFSPDGRFLAVVEEPAPSADGKDAVKTYQVLLLH